MKKQIYIVEYFQIGDYSDEPRFAKVKTYSHEDAAKVARWRNSKARVTKTSDLVSVKSELKGLRKRVARLQKVLKSKGVPW